MKVIVLIAFVLGVALAPSIPAVAGAPAGRYTIGVATVHDTKTKLTWQRSTPVAMYGWRGARDYCESPAVATELGGTGWRLPTKKELLTLVDFSVAIPGPTIDTTAFPSTPNNSFWSLTPLVESSTTAWRVAFDSGGTTTHFMDDLGYVRCVR